MIYTLKGNLNEKRTNLLNDLFSVLDEKNEGELAISRLVDRYQNRSEINAFRRAIDHYERFQSIDDGVFTDEDFMDFFEFLSFSFSEDISFEEFIKVGFYGYEAARSSTSRSSRLREFGHLEHKRTHEQPVADFRKVKQ